MRSLSAIDTMYMCMDSQIRLKQSVRCLKLKTENEAKEVVIKISRSKNQAEANFSGHLNRL